MNNSRPADAVSFLSNACNRELELHLKSGAMKISLQPNKKYQTAKITQPPGLTIMKNLPIKSPKVSTLRHVLRTFHSNQKSRGPKAPQKLGSLLTISESPEEKGYNFFT